MVHTAFAISKNTGDDVGENLGPTIFHIIDPATTMSAVSSQGNEVIFGVNAGKQCVAVSLLSISHRAIRHIRLRHSLSIHFGLLLKL